MASGLYVIVVVCLTSGLWIEANAQKPGRCCSGWTQFDKRCYKFEDSEKAWADAELFCTSLGGNLASIHTEGERTFIRDLIYKATNSHKPTWLGGYDAVKEGKWLWSDGSEYNFAGWGKGEPNNLGGEDCMEINWGAKHIVNDASCDKKRSFICARD